MLKRIGAMLVVCLAFGLTGCGPSEEDLGTSSRATDGAPGTACDETDLSRPNGVCEGPWEYDVAIAPCYALGLCQKKDANNVPLWQPTNCVQQVPCRMAGNPIETAPGAFSRALWSVSTGTGYGGQPVTTTNYWASYAPTCNIGPANVYTSTTNQCQVWADAEKARIATADPSNGPYPTATGTLRAAPVSCPTACGRAGTCCTTGYGGVVTCQPATTQYSVCDVAVQRYVLTTNPSCPTNITHTCPTADAWCGSNPSCHGAAITEPCRVSANGNDPDPLACGAAQLPNNGGNVKGYSIPGVTRTSLNTLPGSYASRSAPVCLTADDVTDTKAKYDRLVDTLTRAAAGSLPGVDAASVRTMAIAKLKLLLELRGAGTQLTDAQRDVIYRYIQVRPDARPACGASNWNPPAHDASYLATINFEDGVLLPAEAGSIVSLVTQGTKAVLLGSTGATTATSTIRTDVGVPTTGGSLTFKYQMVCLGPAATNGLKAWLVDNTTLAVTPVMNLTCVQSGAAYQTSPSFSLAPFAGKLMTLYLSNVQAGTATYTYVDDITYPTWPVEVDASFQACQRSLEPHVTDASRLRAQCVEGGKAALLPTTYAYRSAYLNQYRATTVPLLVKAQALPVASVAEGAVNAELQSQLRDIHRWYGYAGQGLYGQDDAAEVLWNDASKVVGATWIGLYANAYSTFKQSPRTSGPIATLGRDLLARDRELLMAMFSNVAATGKPPLQSAPALLFVSDAMQGVTERLDGIARYHDLGCRFTDCVGKATRTEVSSLYRTLGALADATKLSAELGAANSAAAASPANFSANWPSYRSLLTAISSNHATVIQTAVLDALHSAAPYAAGPMVLDMESGALQPAGTWVSDLTPSQTVYADFGSGTGFSKDLSIAAHPLKLNGVIYSKGLGMHATTELTYSIVNQGYRFFEADVGLDDEIASDACGAAAFEVWLDGVRVFDSGLMVSSSPTKHLKVGVAGGSAVTLKLLKGDGADYCDHGDFAGARFLKDAPAVARPVVKWVDDLTPSQTVYADYASGTGFLKNLSIASHPLTLGGVVYPRGLGLHATTELTYAIANQGYTFFEADVGLDDEIPSDACGAAAFEVWSDGIRYFDSGLVKSSSPTQHVKVDVSGRATITLKLLKGDGNDWCDHGDFAGARLTKEAPPPVTAFAAAVQKAAKRGENFAKTGLFLKDGAKSLPTGLLASKLAAIQGSVAGALGTLDQALRDYQASELSDVGNLITEVDGQISSNDADQRKNALAQRMYELALDDAGLKISATTDQALFGDLGLRFQEASAVLQNKLVSETSLGSFTFNGRDGLFSGGVFNDIRVVAKGGLSGPVTTGQPGEFLNLSVSGTYQPTCALQDMSDFFGTPIDQTALATVDTGSPGFSFVYATGQFHTTSNTDSTTNSVYANVEACAGLSWPKEVSFWSASIQACAGYSWTKSWTEADTTGNDSRRTAAFNTGLRLPNTPFPNFPAGALLAVLTKPGDATVILDALVVTQPQATIAFGQAADVYFVVNDRACLTSGTDRLLAVSAVKLSPATLQMSQVASAMGLVETYLRTQADGIVAQGRLLPEQLAQLKTDAWLKLTTACQSCDPVTFPTATRGFFETWVDNQLRHIAREIEHVSILREMDHVQSEAKALQRDLDLLGTRGRYASLLPRLSLRNLEFANAKLSLATENLRNVVAEQLHPMVYLRYPEAIASLTQAPRLLQIDWVNERVGVWSTTGSSTGDPTTLAGKVYLATTEVLNNLVAAVINSTNASTGDASEVYVAVRYPNPWNPSTIGTLPPPGRAVDPARSRRVWNSILSGVGYAAGLTGPSFRPGDVRFEIRPTDLYDRGPGNGLLSCYMVAPSIRDMAVYLATTVSNPDTWNAQSFLPNTRVRRLMDFTTSKGIEQFRFDNEDWVITPQTKPIFGKEEEWLTKYLAIPTAQRSVSVAGITPFTGFDVNTLGIYGDPAWSAATDPSPLNYSRDPSGVVLNPDRTSDFVVVLHLEARRSASPVKGVLGCP